MPIVNTGKDIKRAGLDPNTQYLATVISVADPRMLGRVRFKIPGILDFPIELSPWAVSSSCDGRGSSYGTFNVPPVGSQVVISFQLGSEYHPKYSNVPLMTTNMMELAKVNYPYRKIMAFENGAYVLVDTKTNEMFINNPGDYKLRITGDANIEVIGDMYASVLGNAYEEVTGDVVQTVTGDMFTDVTGKSVLKVKGDTFLDVQGTVNQKVQGNMVSEVSGNVSQVVTGDMISEVTGKVDQVVMGGMHSEVQGPVSMVVDGPFSLEADSADFTVGSFTVPASAIILG